MASMASRYAMFIANKSPFYRVPDESDFSLPNYDAHTRTLPPGWKRVQDRLWTVAHPSPGTGPIQGWKLHVTSTADLAAGTLDIVWEECVRMGIPFKFLRNDYLLRLINSKYAPRSSSGKFIAVYPDGERRLIRILERLSRRLEGRDGPRILTDFRVPGTPLHFRYGAFHEMWQVLPSGQDTPAIQDPSGSLVPDARRPSPSTPPWVEVPEMLRDAIANDTPLDAAALPYAFTSAIHYSNAGGVYRGFAFSNRERAVVIKEARQYVAVDRNGFDAVQRLRNEYEVLTRLASLSGVPVPLDLRETGGNLYLVETSTEGIPLQRWVAENHPLTYAEVSSAMRSRYLTKVRQIHNALTRIIEEAHSRGVCYGDLHPGNVLVDRQECPALVDFEEAGLIDNTRSRTFGAPGFSFGDGTGVDEDETSLELLYLWMLLPSYGIWEISPESIIQDVQQARSEFGLEETAFAGVEERARRIITTPSETSDRPLLRSAAVPSSGTRECLITLLIRGIAGSRGAVDGLLYPADVGPDSTPWNLAGGAAGTVWTLSRLDVQVPDPDLDWIESAATSTQRAMPGLYTGYAGIALLLHEFGREDARDLLLKRIQTMSDDVESPSMFAGLSGIALAHLAMGNIETATTLAKRITNAFKAESYTHSDGLLHGWGGAAYLFLRLFEETGDSIWCERGLKVLHSESQCLVARNDGSLLLKDGKGRGMPYLANGSAGLLHLLLRFENLMSEESRLTRLIPGLTKSFAASHVANSGLFEGRSGFVMVANFAQRWGLDSLEPVLAMHKHYIGQAALKWRDGALTVGRQGVRLSCDLSHGASGVALALACRGSVGDLPLPGFGASSRTGKGPISQYGGR